MKYDFNGKTVIITGASSGIGREMTKQLIQGFDCTVIGIGRSGERMESLADELGDGKDRFSYRLFDVSDKAEWESLSKELPLLDAIVNNAGMMPPFKNFSEGDSQAVEKTLCVNFLSAAYAIDALLPLLKKSDDGAIINMSSSDALAAVAGTSAYAASKSALKSFSEALSLDLREKIYVATVCPGFVKTDIFRNQTNPHSDSIIDKVCTPADRAVKTLIRRLSRRRKLIVIGADAHAMSIFYKLFGPFALTVIRFVMKKSRLPLFDDVFNCRENRK